VRSVRPDYKRTYFRRARQCKACHYLEKNWVTNNYHRKTRSPKNANKGSYKDFEHAQIKQMKKKREAKKSKRVRIPSNTIDHLKFYYLIIIMNSGVNCFLECAIFFKL
jgi:hypothetical protein